MRKKRRNKFLQTLSATVVAAFLISAFFGAIFGGAIAFYMVKSSGNIFKTASNDKEIIKVVTQEEQIVEVVKEASEAVVSVVVSKDMAVMEQYFERQNPFGSDDFFQQFFGNDFFQFQVPQYRQKGTEKREVGGGTGFIVSQDGLIITNKHVVSDTEAEYTVLTNDGEQVPAAVLATDPFQDIAILKIDKNNLPVLPLGDSDNLDIGSTVIAIGNALGEYRNTVSTGIISGLRRSIDVSTSFGQAEHIPEVIQTDAAINQGNSGGPLLNLSGEVIGINVAMAQAAENIGFSLPINLAKRDLQQVQQEGKISYPFLGIRYIIINPEIKEKNNLSVDYGALIIGGQDQEELAVVPGSAADKAGLLENDIILEFDGQKITEENTLAKLITEHRAGDTVSLKILSKGQEKNIEVTLGEWE